MARRKASRKKSSGIRKFGCLLFFLLLMVAVAGFLHQTPAVWNRVTAFAQNRITAVSQPKAPEEPQVEFSAPPASAQKVQFRYDNLSFGVPGKADTIIDREGYALGYIEYHEQPAWVIYKLTRAEATTKAAKRGNDFREDPQIPTGSATLADYRRSGYDRGHLAPAADMAFSERTMSESFYLSNISPQRPKFNRGVWKDLEEQVRHFAIAEGEIMVVTGPILPKTKSLTIGNNKVTVPTHYYKVIYDLTWKERKLLEVGYLFQKAYWHCGYATETAQACRDYAFQTLHAKSLYSIIRDTNAASRHVAERNRMTVVDQGIKHYRGVDMPHFLYEVKNDK